MIIYVKKLINRCKLSEQEIELNSGSESITTFTKAYAEEFSYTDNHISKFKSSEYNFIIYKNSSCITELTLDMAKVDFGNCYTKVKDEYKINGDLIIVIAEKINPDNPSNPTTSYSFFHPKTGEKLDADTICKDEVITVEENLLSFLNENDTNYELMLFLTEQNINIFNISDEFYTNICFEYESPVKKDIPLKDRISTFYPNATLCDDGCKNSGINLDDMTAKCDCTFNDIANNDLIKENVLLNSIVGEVFDIINNSNIAVLKCYKYIIKYFPKRFGGFITVTLLLCHIILSIIFFSYELNNIKKYVFTMTENYLKFLSLTGNSPNLNSAPPRKLKPIKNKKEEKQNANEEKPKIVKNQAKAKTNILLNIKNKKGTNIKTLKSAIKAKSSKNVDGAKFRKTGAKNTRIMLTNAKLKSNSKDTLLLSNNAKFNNKFRLKTTNDKFKKSEAFENLNTAN